MNPVYRIIKRKEMVEVGWNCCDEVDKFIVQRRKRFLFIPYWSDVKDETGAELYDSFIEAKEFLTRIVVFGAPKYLPPKKQFIFDVEGFEIEQ